MKIVTVIPLRKGPLKEDLTYFSAKDVIPGNIVTIPLRNKEILGLAIGVENVSDSKIDIKDMDFNLRKILDVKENSFFLKEYLDTAKDMAKYFAATKNNVITSLIPAILREKYDEIAKFEIPTKLPSKNAFLNSVKNEKLLFQAPPEDRYASYKTLIRESFALKKSVFVVLPTERDIKLVYNILSRGIEQFTFDVGSGTSLKKTLLKLKEILTTTHPVLIIGTAPYLSLPRTDIGTIIIEHESSSSYRTIQKPHLDLRIFVETFATKRNAKLILSDTMLRFETIGRSEIDGLTPMHPLSFRTSFAGDIEIPQKKEKFELLCEESIQEIGNVLERNKNVFIFSLRKGLATQTVCRDCNSTVNCETCLAPAVLYLSRDQKRRIFSCNRCKKELDAETKCASCGSWNLMPLGIGTDTVYEEAKKVFPDVKIFKLDKETAKNAKGALDIIKNFQESKGAILIGTEMAFIYLTEKTPLSIIASFDSLWSIPNYKMSEKIIQIILSIIGKTTEKIIVQTKNENDPAILSFKNENLLSFVREELNDRKHLGYPPYKRFIKLTHSGDKEAATTARETLKEILEGYEPEIFSGFVAKSLGNYTTNALLKVDLNNWSLPELHLGSKIDEVLLGKLQKLPPEFEVTVDPEDLL